MRRTSWSFSKICIAPGKSKGRARKSHSTIRGRARKSHSTSVFRIGSRTTTSKTPARTTSVGLTPFYGLEGAKDSNDDEEIFESPPEDTKFVGGQEMPMTAVEACGSARLWTNVTPGMVQQAERRSCGSSTTLPTASMTTTSSIKSNCQSWRHQWMEDVADVSSKPIRGGPEQQSSSSSRAAAAAAAEQQQQQSSRARQLDWVQRSCPSPKKLMTHMPLVWSNQLAPSSKD
jgi:hypothetical protein